MSMGGWVSVELDPLVGVACGAHVADEVVEADVKRGAVVVGMEGEVGVVLQVLVEEDVNVVLGIVDKSEGADGACLQTKIFVHAPLGGEAHLSLMQYVLKVVNGHIVVALEDDEVVAVALVVAEEEVLAMGARQVAPVGAPVVDGGRGGMLGVGELYA